MSTALEPGAVVRAAALPLEHEELDAEQVVSGSPTTGWTDLGEIGGAAVGIWEITPGTSTDVEADEVFVVLSGAATINVAAGDGRPAVALVVGPGDVVRLAAGMRTTWTVSATLRKVYLAPSG